MELTAIKSRGKQKSKNDKAAKEGRKALVRIFLSSSTHFLTTTQKRPGGRPLKLAGSTEDTQSSTNSEPPSKRHKKRSLKNIKSKRKMSDLEKLPTEILETIFLFSLNFNLPNASPVIAGKLSSPIMFKKTIMAVFGPTWERWHGRERNRLQKRVAKETEHTDEDPILQSEVLRCRWATLPVVLKTKDLWIQKFAKDRDFKPACKYWKVLWCYISSYHNQGLSQTMTHHQMRRKKNKFFLNSQLNIISISTSKDFPISFLVREMVVGYGTNALGILIPTYRTA